MNKFKAIQLILSLCIMTFSALVYAIGNDSDEAHKLISQHIQASGGTDALMNMKSISRYGNISFYTPDGPNSNFCYHTDIVYPYKLREQIKDKEILYDRGTDGASYWSWTGSQYDITNDEQLIDYMKGTAERANRDMIWVKSSAFNVLPALPSWVPKNSRCIQAVETDDSSKRIYCFDASSSLLNAIGTDEEYRIESDWREVGNIKIPFHLTHYKNGIIIFDLQLDHAELNNAIPDSQFVTPHKQSLSC